MSLLTILNGLVLKAQAIHICSSSCAGMIVTTWGTAEQQEDHDAYVLPYNLQLIVLRQQLARRISGQVLHCNDFFFFNG